MTRLPRSLSGEELVRRLRKLEYRVIRQHGSHAVLKTPLAGGHLCFIPMHKAIKPGTLEDILKGIAAGHGLRLNELLELLDL